MRPRAIVIGLDAAPLELIARFAKEGALPNIAALMRRGSANRALACIPAWTPTNWATLATGAWPGTHGCANWDDRAPGKPLGWEAISTFDARAVMAETVWEAAERQGLTSLVMAYPGASPSRLKKGMVVAPLQAGLVSRALAHGCRYVAGGGEGVRVELSKPQGWRNLPRGVAFEAQIALGPGRAPEAVEDGHEKTPAQRRAATDALHLLLTRGGVLLSARKDASRPLAVARPGKWSEWLFLNVSAGGRAQKATVRFKLERADLSRPAMSLIRSEVYPAAGLTEPDSLSRKLIAQVGPYFEHPALGLASKSAYDASVYEELRYQVDWHAQAAAYLLGKRGWDIFYNHWHFPDNAGHSFLGLADPRSPAYDAVRAQECIDSMREVYRIADRLVGGFMKLAGPETYFIVVADHGNVANRFGANLPLLLERAGLAAYVKNAGASGQPSLDVDWARTRAYYLGGVHICVNLKGRNPKGIVPARDYERTQERIIDALLNWKDPETGARAIAIALKKRDAQLIGHWGERCGDVVFVYNSGFAWQDPGAGRTVGPARGSANHGPQLPTTQLTISSNMAAFIIAGPGIRRGYRRDEDRLGLMRLVDVVPTLCHVLGIEPPRQSQGCVLYDLLA